MKIAIVTILALVGCIQARIAPKIISDDYIAHINAEATTWVAGRNFPEGTTIEHLKGLLGTKRSPKNSLKYKVTEEIPEGSIPESFDARQRWANCTSISMIRDQSQCGSCWAVASTSVMSDRICIHSNGQKQTQVSAADLISCCQQCGRGCGGGFPPDAYNYWQEIGLVSGGDYGTGIGCKPYPFPRCNQFNSTSKYPECPNDEYPTPKCSKQCENKQITYSQDLNRADSVYMLRLDVAKIQNEILTNGPVSADFDVYEDFYYYKSGVYQKTKKTDYAGGHSVRVIGWGVENNIPYWLAANSWNEEWGDNGTFKILRGSSECNFEGEIMAGIPQK